MSSVGVELASKSSRTPSLVAVERVDAGPDDRRPAPSRGSWVASQRSISVAKTPEPLGVVAAQEQPGELDVGLRGPVARRREIAGNGQPGGLLVGPRGAELGVAVLLLGRDCLARSSFQPGRDPEAGHDRGLAAARAAESRSSGRSTQPHDRAPRPGRARPARLRASADQRRGSSAARNSAPGDRTRRTPGAAVRSTSRRPSAGGRGRGELGPGTSATDGCDADGACIASRILARSRSISAADW